MSTISGSISFAGLGSGSDFQAMVDQLKKVEEIPKNRYVIQQKNMAVRYEAIDSILTEVNELARSMRSMSSVSKLMQKKVGFSTKDIVSATATDKAVDGSHSIDVKQLATNTILTNSSKYGDPKVPVTKKDQEGLFAYEYKGKVYQVELGKDCSLEGMVNAINKDPSNPGVTAGLVKSGNTYLFQLQGKDTGKDATLSISPLTNIDGFTGTNASISGSLGAFDGEGTGKNTVINKTPNAIRKFCFTYTDDTGNKQSKSIDVKNGMTVDQLASEINKDKEKTGVIAKITADKNGDAKLSLECAKGPVEIADGTPAVECPALWNKDCVDIVSSSNNWTERPAQDAEYTIDGVENVPLTSSTNKLNDLFPGVTVTLEGVGKTNINISTSTEDMKKNIEEFVKNTNEALAKIKELTAVSEDKKVDTANNDYAALASGVKGSILTGNTGVQMLESRLRGVLTGSATGFRAKSSKDDKLGDSFTALASIGIVMDAKTGQLKFLTEGETTLSGKVSSDDKDDTNVKVFKTLDEALREDPAGVAELLAGTGGISESPNVSYDSHISGTTKPGNYEISYDVDAAGKATNVRVNGMLLDEASYDKDSEMYVVGSGPAKGLSFSIDNKKEGESQTALIRIKEGKFTEIANMLTKELSNEPIDKDNPTVVNKGTLVILKENYRDTIQNLQKKIDSETNRISAWERRERLRFSRLDTLLGKYNNQMSANAAVLGQLTAGQK